MKREELKEYIEGLVLDFYPSTLDDVIEAIDEYTKPKTKKKINATTRLRNKDRREARKL